MSSAASASTTCCMLSFMSTCPGSWSTRYLFLRWARLASMPTAAGLPRAAAHQPAGHTAAQPTQITCKLGSNNPTQPAPSSSLQVPAGQAAAGGVGGAGPRCGPRSGGRVVPPGVHNTGEGAPHVAQGLRGAAGLRAGGDWADQQRTAGLQQAVSYGDHSAMVAGQGSRAACRVCS